MRGLSCTATTIDRAKPVARFQRGKVLLFLISLKASGTGLNLTAADTVIHYGPWWNPAVEDQATDRAYRIGQDKPVFVYELVAQGAVEERMLELQQRKKALAAGIFEAGGGAAAALEVAEIEPRAKSHCRRTQEALSVLEEREWGGALAARAPLLDDSGPFSGRGPRDLARTEREALQPEHS